MTSSASLTFSQYTVDLWWTDLNDVEFGLFRHTKHRAKSRQFSKDSDVIGAVVVNGERKGLLTYRRGLWEDGKGMSKRLVVKLFTDEMSWRGTMDMLLGRSMQLTMGAKGFPVPSFLVNISGHEQTISVERSGRKWPFTPENYSFFIADGKNARFYRLRRDFLAFGADYTLYDENNNRIGHLNGRVIDLGGRWDVSIREDHDSAQLNGTLQLFCGMLRFRRACERHIRQLTAGIRDGSIKPKLETHEVELYDNPRANKR
ncbi:MAG: hypothetical protein P8Y67_01875 [Alphaproteobacteria bacterium]